MKKNSIKGDTLNLNVFENIYNYMFGLTISNI